MITSAAEQYSIEYLLECGRALVMGVPCNVVFHVMAHWKIVGLFAKRDYVTFG